MKTKIKNTLFKCKSILFCLFLTATQVSQINCLHGMTTYLTNILESTKDITPLFKAIKEGNAASVQEALQSGCDVNDTFGGSYTALMAAVYKGDLEIIKLLVQAGAELDSYDSSGNTPFMFAFYDTTPKPAVVAYLLSLNVDTNIINDQEYTPLILASLNNHVASIKLLIEAGVNIEEKGQSNATALLLATGNNCVEAVKALASAGADIETRNEFSLTPLMTAAFDNQGSMLRTLIKLGADLNARTTKRVPVSIKKDRFDFFPTTVYIPVSSTALDIAKQFEKHTAENVLKNAERSR